MLENGPPATEVVFESSLKSTKFDGILLITTPSNQQQQQPPPLYNLVADALKYDPTLTTELTILPLTADYPAGRLIVSPTGPIDPDYDDVRIYKKAILKAVKRALKAGIVRPLLILGGINNDDIELVILLGALEALYVPIQVREGIPAKRAPVEYLGVYSENPDKAKSLINLATILEQGRRVACDIGDGDPERMSPPRIEDYITNIFKNSPIKINVVKEQKDLVKEYPLFEAVNRAANQIDRHQGRIVFLDYHPTGQIQETLFIVGKGVTFDTGGIDVKINGAMIGMSRDKCGAAAVIGFMEIVRLLQPKHLRIVAGVSLVRNSIGPNGYVADELIVARSGARVRIFNTDAEGRMAMADVLCKMKELAINAVNPHLFTIATLTGHAYLTVGEGYSIVMDNGPAKRAGNSAYLQQSGDRIGDLFEISTIRSEDFQAHRGVCEGDDVKQSNNQPSSRTPRGHQGPAAFLILASGLDKHGTGSKTPLKYSHLDIAASAGEYPQPATGSPVLALAKAYLL